MSKYWQDNSSWPILSEEDEHDLFRRSVSKEYSQKKPRHVADSEAYHEWRKDSHAKAAAHHLLGMRAAQGAGDMEQAKKHGVFYKQHMDIMGHSPYEAPPEAVRRYAQGGEHQSSVYSFKGHGGDSLIVPTDHEPIQKSMVTLSKASRNVKENRARLNPIPEGFIDSMSDASEEGRQKMVSEVEARTKSAHARIMGWIQAKGVDVRQIPYSNNGFYNQETTSFGGGSNGQEVAVWPGDGVAFDHEASHALLTPVGQTMAQRQQRLGSIGNTFEEHEPIEDQHDEAATQAFQGMMRRRVGLPVSAKVTKLGDTDNSFFTPTRGFGGPKYVDGLKDSHIVSNRIATSPVTTPERHAIALGIAQKRMAALEEGRLALDGKGQMAPGTSIHAKINQRALGKSEYTPQEALAIVVAFIKGELADLEQT